MPDGAAATPDVPPDHGLLGLGLLMQSVGGVMLALMSGLALIGLVAEGLAGQGKVLVLAITGLGAWASAVLLLAGRAVSAREGGVVGRIRTYAFVSWAQIVVLVAFSNMTGGMPLEVGLLSLGLPLAVWPTMMFVVSSLEPYRGLLEEGVPETPDRGLEGLSIYMALFGGIGLVLSLLLVYLLVKGEAIRAWQGVVVLITLILLVLRAGLDVSAGLKGAVRQAWSPFQEAAARYGSVGIGVAVATGVLFSIIALAERRQEASQFIIIAMLVAVLLVWPLVVGRFVADRRPSGSRSLATPGSAPALASAPDRGLTALGWLLLSAGVFAVVQTLGTLLLGRRGGGPFSTGALGSATVDQVFSLLTAGLACAAGFSLVRMAPAFKVVTLAYAGVATLLNLIAFVRVLEYLPFMMRGPVGPVLIAALAISLVVPVGSGLLVLRGSSRSA